MPLPLNCSTKFVTVHILHSWAGWMVNNMFSWTTTWIVATMGAQYILRILWYWEKCEALWSCNHPRCGYGHVVHQFYGFHVWPREINDTKRMCHKNVVCIWSLPFMYTTLKVCNDMNFSPWFPGWEMDHCKTVNVCPYGVLHIRIQRIYHRLQDLDGLSMYTDVVTWIRKTPSLSSVVNPIKNKVTHSPK